MRWLVLSDVHERTGLLSRLETEAREARGIVLSGDLTMFGGAPKARDVVSRVRELNDTVLAIPGNTDHTDALAWFEAEGISLHGQAIALDGIAFYGVGGSNPTPFNTPFELPEDEITEVLTRAHEAALATGAERRVLVSHPPPYRSGVDKLWSGGLVGSKAVRAHIEQNRPDAVLSGHIHEARGHGEVDGVPVYNPGPFGGGGYTRLDVDGEGVRGEVIVMDRSKAARVTEGVGAIAHKVSRLGRKKPSPRGGPAS